MNAFITLTPELALEQADAADQLRRKAPQSELSPLLGLPMAVKDVLAVANVRCTCGSRILENFIPPYKRNQCRATAQSRHRYRRESQCRRVSQWDPLQKIRPTGQHTNPWDMTRSPGGSSGGSAAAVAGRMIPAALGTDTGGSVRQPASFCGVTGLKTTYGRVSRYGLVAYGSSLDSVGALAQSAEDLVLIFEEMAGVDPRDATSMDLPVPKIELTDDPDLRGLRVGVPEEYFIEGIQPEVEKRRAKKPLPNSNLSGRKYGLSPCLTQSMPCRCII